MNRSFLYKYLFVALLPFGVGCSLQDEDAGEHIAFFYREEPKFEQLVESLWADPVSQRRQGHTVFWKAFSYHTKRRLQELGITHVHLFAGGRHLDLKTNWGGSRPVYLCYREGDGFGLPNGSFTIQYRLNASWTLCARSRS